MLGVNVTFGAGMMCVWAGVGVAVGLRKALLFRICLPRVNPSEFRCAVGVLRDLNRGKSYRE